MLPWRFFAALVLVATATPCGSAVPLPPRGFGTQSTDIRVGCSEGGASWRQNVSFGVERGDAQFLVFRFVSLALPRGARLRIRDGFRFGSSSDRGAVHIGDGATAAHAPFFTRPLHARRAVVEYTAPPGVAVGGEDEHSDACYGFHIDQYRFAAVGGYREGDTTRRRYRKKEKDARPRRLGNDQDEYDFGGGSTMGEDAAHGEDVGTVAPPDDYYGAAAETQEAQGKEEEEGDATMADECVGGADTSARAACVRYSAAMFSASRAVARLLIHKAFGSIFCTGWLFGCEGHVLTNHHCVGSAADANATFIEFLAQGTACVESCDAPLGCPGVIEATASQLVAFSPPDALDFALLLPRLTAPRRRALVASYGFLSMRARGAARSERIFIPQHPAGFGKRVALKHGAAYGRVAALDDAGCNARRESVAYLLATQGGSSGAPVVAFDDGAVVGLHYCGGCLNSAVPSNRIVEALADAAALPRCAQAEFDWSPASGA